MADTKLAVVPTPTSVGTTIKALLQSHLALGRATVELQRQRDEKLDALVDAFALAPLKADNFAVESLRLSQEREAKKQAYIAQEAAFTYWAGEVDDRLAKLAKYFSDDIVRALDAELASLKDQQKLEQGQVQEVELFIAEFEGLRALLVKAGAATEAKSTAAKRRS